MPSHTVDEIIKKMKAGEITANVATALIRDIFVREGKTPQNALGEATKAVSASVGLVRTQPGLGIGGPNVGGDIQPPGGGVPGELPRGDTLGWREYLGAQASYPANYDPTGQYTEPVTFSDDPGTPGYYGGAGGIGGPNVGGDIAPPGGGGGLGGGGLLPSTEELDRIENERLSEFASGRNELFTRYLAGLGHTVNPIMRNLMRQRGAPLSAQFGLSGVSPTLSGQVPDSYLAYLQGNPGRFTKEQYQQGLMGLGPAFQEGAELTPEQQEQRIALDYTREGGMGRMDFARNLITQSYLAGVSPFLRRSAATRLSNAFDAFRGQNPTASLFAEFVKKGFKF